MSLADYGLSGDALTAAIHIDMEAEYILDDQCRRYYEKSCAALLEEARLAMEADG